MEPGGLLFGIIGASKQALNDWQRFSFVSFFAALLHPPSSIPVLLIIGPVAIKLDRLAEEGAGAGQE